MARFVIFDSVEIMSSMKLHRATGVDTVSCGDLYICKIPKNSQLTILELCTTGTQVWILCKPIIRIWFKVHIKTLALCYTKVSRKSMKKSNNYSFFILFLEEWKL